MKSTARAWQGGLVLGLALATAAAAELPDTGPEEVVRALTRAIDHFDHEGFMAAFAPEITMFYPIDALARRVDGAEALAATQRRVFDVLAARFAEQGRTEGPYFGLVPQELETQRLGDGAAVVTWHVDRGTHLGRRTAVLELRSGGWKIVSYHASNVATTTE